MVESFAELIESRIGTDVADPVLTFVEILDDGSFANTQRSYADLHDRGARLAAWLASKGLGRGDRFAIMMNNHPEFVDAMVAASMLGAAFVPIDARTRGEKLAYLIQFTECAGVIVADYCAAQLAEVAEQCRSLSWTLLVGDERAAADARLPAAAWAADLDGIEPAPGTRGAEPDDPLFLMFTSGTTGKPKAVVQTHRQYLASTRAPAHFGLGDSDRFYTGLSLTHINAQGIMRIALGSGTPMVISRKFTKQRLWDIVRAYRCTIFSLLGGMIPEMFSIPERPDDADNPVRMIVTSGMPAGLWEAYRKRFGVEIAEGYGSTEGGGVLANPPGVGPIGSIGKPPPGLEAAAFNEAGQRCRAFELGELRFRPEGGEARPVSYFRNEAAGLDKIRGGWFATGDIVYQDEDGWFYFQHRVGGGVRRNGDFVNTALVEAVISRSRMVDDVFVYGVATERNVAGEKVLVAAVVPADPRSFDVGALKEYCAAHLERNDVPEIVQVLTAIPKTASEKPIEQEAIALLRKQAPDLSFI
jgi:carnitine-CoA ligase